MPAFISNGGKAERLDSAPGISSLDATLESGLSDEEWSNRMAVEITRDQLDEQPLTEAEQFYASIRNFITDAPVPQELIDKGYQRKVFVHTAAGEVIVVRSIGYQKPNHLFFGGVSLRSGEETWMITQACSAQVIVKAVLPEQEREPSSLIGFPHFTDELEHKEED